MVSEAEDNESMMLMKHISAGSCEQQLRTQAAFDSVQKTVPRKYH